jgi:hypothetical protein
VAGWSEKGWWAVAGMAPSPACPDIVWRPAVYSPRLLAPALRRAARLSALAVVLAGCEGGGGDAVAAPPREATPVAAPPAAAVV